MNAQIERLDGAAKVLVVAAKKPHFTEATGNAVVVADRLVRDDLFTTAPVFALTCPFRNWRDGREELSRNIPRLSTERAAVMCAALDRRAIVKCGSTVQYGDLLVGKVASIRVTGLTEEEKMLRAIFGRSNGKGDERRDYSLYYHFRDAGVVCNVEVLSPSLYPCASCGDIPGNMAKSPDCPFCGGPLGERKEGVSPNRAEYVVKVDVVVRRKLCLGDVLRDGKGNEFTVARIVPQWDMPCFRGEEVDVLVSADSSIASHLNREGVLRRQKNWCKTRGDRIRLEKVRYLSSEKMVYRGIGPVSDFTYLPTSSDMAFPGQKVSQAMLKVLLGDGYAANVREMLSIKADSDEGRTAAYEALVKGEAVSFGVPDTTNRLWALLNALCFVPRLMDEVGNEVKVSTEAGSATSLAFQGMTTADVRALSYGQVKNFEALDSRTQRAVKGGLFCERIFGPVRDWECFCGKYRGLKYTDVVCDRCGVKVAHSRVRRRRFGHIELPVPVMHPGYLQPVSDALGLSPETVQRVLLYNEELDAPLATKRGPLAIKEYLEQKGVNSNSVFLEAIPVLPAGLRRHTLDEAGNRWTNDCTDLYRRVINRSNRWQKLCRLNAPEKIIECESRLIEGAVAALFCNEITSRPVVDNRGTLHSLCWELTHLLKQILEKRVDYSGRMVVIPNSELQPATVGIPLKALLDLYQPLVIRELKARGFADTIRSARKMIERDAEGAVVREALVAAMQNRPLLLVTEVKRVAAFSPVVRDGETLHLHPDDASRLGIRFAGEQVTLYLPLTAMAVAEIREPQPLEDTFSVLSDLTPFNLLPEMVWTQTSLVLKPLDKIALGIGR